MGVEQARDLMKGFCRVCPVCNGKACVGEVPGMGGTGSGSSFIANVEALANIKLKMKVLATHSIPSTNTSLLGLDLDIPVLAAPIGGTPFNMSKEIPEEQYIMSLLQGCYEQGTIGCTGDGVPDYVYKSGFAAIKAVHGKGIPFIKPWEDAAFLQKAEQAKDLGTEIIGIDIDSIGLGTVKMMGTSIPLRTPKQLEALIKKIPFKVILKGIMTPEEAQFAIDAGATAIVVSNHGGRVLDSAPGTAQVLPAIAQQVNGRIPILVDGGVRFGADVLKMLALGAQAVMIGRPLTIAVFSDFENGVQNYLAKIKKELVQSMLLTGCEKISDIDSNILYS